MIPYLPHSAEDRDVLLGTIGASSVDDLFADIPSDILVRHGLDLPSHRSEFEVYRHLEALSRKNRPGVCFLGGGVYDHLIPSVVSFVSSRTEFLSAYTPYQAEMSQGILQAIFEFQSMMCELTGLDVSNASLYDGATAAAEACAMAVNSVRRSDTILYSSTLHQSTIDVMETFFSNINIHLVRVDAAEGVLSLDDLSPHLRDGIAGVIVQSPNRFGCLEDYSGFAEAIHSSGAKFIISANPISLGMLRPPGEWDADMAIGDGQPLGLAPNYGGPGVGFLCAKKDLMRKMPGRIVGETVDSQGQRAFVLTLQAREQHIKRERATSNICTNQALAALSVAAYLSCVGPRGLADAAELCYQKAHYLFHRTIDESAAKAVFKGKFFHEFALRLPKPANQVVVEMAKDGIDAGIPLGDNLDTCDLLVAVTEKRTRDELDSYVESLARCLHG